MRFSQLLKQVLLVCVSLFALTGQAIADPWSDSERAYDAGNYEEAVKLIRPLAEQGKPSAQGLLGVMYKEGKGVPQDYKEAAKWYQLSAEQGNDRAQVNLGNLYYHGEGVQQNYKEAVKWYRLSAEQGNVGAQIYLSGMYASGQGVPQDFVLENMWMNIAAANATDSDTQEKIAEMRDSSSKSMTASQIAEAQELARKCTTNKFKGC